MLSYSSIIISNCQLIGMCCYIMAAVVIDFKWCLKFNKLWTICLLLQHYFLGYTCNFINMDSIQSQILRHQKFASFQEVTISSFFGEVNPEFTVQHQDGIRKKPREKGFPKKP